MISFFMLRIIRKNLIYGSLLALTGVTLVVFNGLLTLSPSLPLLFLLTKK